MMAMPIHSPGPTRPAPSTGKRRSVFGKAIRGVGWIAVGPVDWVGVRRISRGASLIGDLWSMLRRRSPAGEAFKLQEGQFDLVAAAASYGLSLEDLHATLASRRRHTARIAYAAAGFGGLFLLGWLFQALSSPWAQVRLSSALSFLPFSVLFFLVGFYNALLNFQIRIGRVASWREYLMTEGRFRPS